MNWNRSSTAHQRTRGRKWRKIRERIFARDKHLCQPCRRKGKTTLAIIVDHIVALFEGGTDDEENLESSCKPCSDAKTAQESARAQGRSAPRARACDASGWPL